MADRGCTPGQTIGPFFAVALATPGANRLIDDGQPGAIRLHGGVYDGAGQPVPDALVEMCQLDAPTGWGRCATDAAGRYEFTTRAPGSTGKPAFFAITVFARGLLDRLFTRAYLPGGDLGGDPVLAGLAADRRKTLICLADSGGYRFDIHLQGPRETVFFEFRGARR